MPKKKSAKRAAAKKPAGAPKRKYTKSKTDYLTEGKKLATYMTPKDRQKVQAISAHYGFATQLTAIRFSVKRLFDAVKRGEKLPAVEPEHTTGQRMPMMWRQEESDMLDWLRKKLDYQDGWGFTRLVRYAIWVEAERMKA